MFRDTEKLFFTPVGVVIESFFALSFNLDN